MSKIKMRTIQKPEAWGLTTTENGILTLDGICMTDLADKYGTPLHVINERRLFETALDFVKNAEDIYPGVSSVHYPFKCNAVPYVLSILKSAGMRAETATEFELNLALRMGFAPDDIIVNGPGKTDIFIRQAVSSGVGLIVLDSIDEIQTTYRICKETETKVKILLRINPDFIPSGMNSGSATGSRKGSVFGLDFHGAELKDALSILNSNEYISFQGYHFHIGTGIRVPKDYSKCFRIIKQLLSISKEYNLKVNVIDVGGGYASSTTREMTTTEMLIYQGIGKMPAGIDDKENFVTADFIREISHSIVQAFGPTNLPKLIFEPGRSIVSSNQLLLLKVNAIKERQGLNKWIITDGGISTVCLPVYYEYHEIFLCNEVHRKPLEKVTITGPACFSGDVIYKNKLMPRLQKNEIIAIMDSGAYFIPMESSFGFPKPAIAAVNTKEHKIVRKREEFDDMINRDIFYTNIFERN